MEASIGTYVSFINWPPIEKSTLGAWSAGKVSEKKLYERQRKLCSCIEFIGSISTNYPGDRRQLAGGYFHSHCYNINYNVRCYVPIMALEDYLFIAVHIWEKLLFILFCSPGGDMPHFLYVVIFMSKLMKTEYYYCARFLFNLNFCSFEISK